MWKIESLVTVVRVGEVESIVTGVRMGKVESLVTVVRVEKVEYCANYRCTCREGRRLC